MKHLVVYDIILSMINRFLFSTKSMHLSSSFFSSLFLESTDRTSFPSSRQLITCWSENIDDVQLVVSMLTYSYSFLWLQAHASATMY